MDYSELLLQVSAGWKHGDGGVDEQAKSHPLLKSYKALSEKVQALWCTHTGAGGGTKLSPDADCLHTFAF